MRQRFLVYLLISVVFGSVCRAEFQVNTHTTGEQRNADIAADSLGSFAVVWSSYGQDGSSNGLFAQRFDPNLSPVGEESPVDTTTVGNQTESAVAMDAEGNFVVVWHGPAPVEQDSEDIFARRFDPNGGALGDEFGVNSLTVNSQLYPSVAVNNDLQRTHACIDFNLEWVFSRVWFCDGFCTLWQKRWNCRINAMNV